MTDDLPARLRGALTVAIKARDRPAVTALRTALAALDNATAVSVRAPAAPTDGPIAGAVAGLGTTEAARRELTDADVAAVIETQIAAREEAAVTYEQAGRPEPAADLRAEVAVLRGVMAGGGGSP
jgi:uncharacterized protein YqeY